MQTSRFSLCLALLGSLSSLTAASFSDMAPHLDQDGELLAYADFSGDSQIFGDRLTEIYSSVMLSNPQMGGIPLDFAQIFDALGFNSFGAFGYSAKEVGPDIYRNRGVALYDGAPTGLLAMTDMTPRAFTAAEMAPADASLALNMHLRIDVLRDTIADAAARVMGPMGQGMVLGTLENPILPSGLTGNQIIAALSNPIGGHMSQSFDMATGQPKFDFYVEIENAGDLAAQLSGLTAMQPNIVVTEEDGATILDLSALTAEAGFSLYVRGAPGESLRIYTQEAYLEGPADGASLAETPEFLALRAYLPDEAASFVYSSGTKMDEIRTMLGANPETANYLPVFDAVADGLLGDFFAPYIAASYPIEGGAISDTYASYSAKEFLAAAPFTIVGLTAAMAIPAFQKVRATSQEKAVTANLRQIASAAQQYMLDEGVAEATYDDIVGEGKYIDWIESVAGEDYSGIVIDQYATEISVELPSGQVVTYQF